MYDNPFSKKPLTLWLERRLQVGMGDPSEVYSESNSVSTVVDRLL